MDDLVGIKRSRLVLVKLVSRSSPRGTRNLSRWLGSRTCLSNEWLVASKIQRVTDPFQVNAQRVLWQKRCDRFVDQVSCNHFIDDKDNAFAQGKGLDWIPDNCSVCRPVGRIFEQTVTYREWQEPLMYTDDKPHTMWAWNPLSKNKHYSCVVFIPPCHPRAKSLPPLT